jgi:acetyltransferase-like isoleucine patch superfamily enzyme
MAGRKFFNRISIIINIFSSIISIFPSKLNVQVFYLLRYFPGKMGIGFRYLYLRSLAIKCGKNVSIHQGVYLKSIRKLAIGNNVSIHPMCYIDAAGGLEIKDNVSIAHSCSILTTNHQWSDISIPIKYNNIIYGKVSINDDVWIGCGCRILAGVTIGNRAIVAAGAVVNKNVENNTIVGGIPAKILKNI